jgi:hypothetical protein
VATPFIFDRYFWASAGGIRNTSDPQSSNRKEGQMMRTVRYVWLSAVTAALCIGLSQPVSANTFGEVAGSIGGIYPQGSFTHYADPGFTVNGRITIHLPVLKFMVGWMDLSYVQFSSDKVETRRQLYDFDNGITIWRPVEQTTEETMIAGHLGLQLASTTRRAFFRPRAALGLGIYGFENSISWKEKDGDSDVTLATETLDEQTRLGWRALLGVDFFVTAQWGATVDFIYDHVFGLNQQDGPSAAADLTSRFQGFSLGVIYMFNVK